MTDKHLTPVIIQRLLLEAGATHDLAQAIAKRLEDDDRARHDFVTKSDLQSELRKIAAEIEMRMTIRFGGMIMALGGILIAVKYFG